MYSDRQYSALHIETSMLFQYNGHQATNTRTVLLYCVSYMIIKAFVLRIIAISSGKNNRQSLKNNVLNPSYSRVLAQEKNGRVGPCHLVHTKVHYGNKS